MWVFHMGCPHGRTGCESQSHSTRSWTSRLPAQPEAHLWCPCTRPLGACRLAGHIEPGFERAPSSLAASTTADCGAVTTGLQYVGVITVRGGKHKSGRVSIALFVRGTIFEAQTLTILWSPHTHIWRAGRDQTPPQLHTEGEPSLSGLDPKVSQYQQSCTQPLPM